MGQKTRPEDDAEERVVPSDVDEKDVDRVLETGPSKGDGETEVREERGSGWRLSLGMLAILALIIGLMLVSFVGNYARDTAAEAMTKGKKETTAMDLYLPTAPRAPPSAPMRLVIGATGTPSTPPGDEGPDTMVFEGVQDNPFITVAEDPLSTFAMDVDTGSYTIARAYLTSGRLPPPEAVRTEEFINYFRQDYEPPEGLPFEINVDGAPSRFGPGLHLLRIGLQAQQIDPEDRKPAQLTFVIDISGSMNRDNRLGLVKESLRLLVDELGPKDSVGIAVYGDTGRTYLEHTPADKKDVILKAIDALASGGSTNAEEGLVIGYRMALAAFRAEAINRVILCSDGVANVGRTGPEEILAEIEKNREGGITLSTVGFGMGNYNDVLMETLADRGDGNYAYVDTIAEARRMFVTELVGTLQVVARDAKVQVEFEPKAVVRYRLLGYENRAIRDEDFRNDTVDAGEVGAGHRVTALYEVELVEDPTEDVLGVVRIRYLPPDGVGEAEEVTRWLHRDALAPSFEAASARFRLTAAVAELAELLRGSGHASDGSIGDVVTVARIAAGELDWDPDAGQFVKLAEAAQSATAR